MLGGALLSLAGSAPFALSIALDPAPAGAGAYLTLGLALIVAFVLFYAYLASRSASITIVQDQIHIRFGSLLYLRLGPRDIAHFAAPIFLEPGTLAPRLLYPIGTLLLGSGGEGLVLRLIAQRRIALWPFFPPGPVLRIVLVPASLQDLVRGLEQAGIKRIGLEEDTPAP